MLAIPVHIKVWPLAAAGLLIACRPRHLAAQFTICLAGVAVLPFLGETVRLGVPAILRMVLGAGGPRPRCAASIATPGRSGRRSTRQPNPRPRDARSSVGLSGLATGHGRAGAGALPVAGRRSQPVARLLLFVLVMWTSWQAVFGPGMERNAFGLMAPLTCWGLITCFEQERGQVIMGVAFALTIGATFGVLERHLEGVFPLIRAAHPIGVLLFSGWFLWWNRSAGDVKPVGQVPVRKPPRTKPALTRWSSRFRCLTPRALRAKIP